MMWRRLIWSVPMVLALCAAAHVLHAAALVPQSDAKRCGLTRAWYAQVGSPQATGPVNHVNYSDGALLVQTTAGMLTALDAETGRTLWGRQVGPRGRWTSEAAANKEHIAVVVGSQLYVLDRQSGTLLWVRQLAGVPAPGRRSARPMHSCR